MLSNNFILKTDSYKMIHWNQYPDDTEYVYSYFESRNGAEWPFTLFFGLQYLLKKYFVGQVVTQEDIDEAERLAIAHFGDASYFNREGWEYILNEHGGKLPLKIKAVPEGTRVTVSNVLMTVENTDPKCYWLTNYVESILTHVWYGSTVATLSRSVKDNMLYYLDKTGNVENINFMLHDFGYRGVNTDEGAALGGAGHIVNFMGTDTLVAMAMAVDYYNASLDTLAFSVPATEHSIMTSKGVVGEYEILDDLLETYPTGILSVVADSYNIYHFTEQVIGRKEKILSREGRFVLRPDSVTPKHDTPEKLVVHLVKRLWDAFGGTYKQGKESYNDSPGIGRAYNYKVLDDHIRVIWGDGIDANGIQRILKELKLAGFSADNIVFGMGGGLLQKVSRDTQRFAFKSSAQCRSGVWYDVQKSPLDASKKSKAGRLALIHDNGTYKTVCSDFEEFDVLRTVFLNGELLVDDDFDTIRSRSNK